MSSRTTELRLLTLAGCVAALAPRLAHRGMFLDGVTYASIARNMAEGRGSFWEPFYTATIYPVFHEHLPLGFWLQSLWFRALGDRWFVERLYCVTAAAVVATLIAVIWRAAYESADPRERSERGDDAWLAIGLWMLAPVVSWSIVGNLLETTVSVFDTAAVAAITVRPRTSPARALLRGSLAGLAVAAAVLSKGPVGLFPLASPVAIAWLLPDRRRASMQAAAGLWLTFAACVALLLAVPAAHGSMTTYFDQQVVASLAGRREVSGSPLAIVIELLQGVCLTYAIAIAALIGFARGWSKPAGHDLRVAAAFAVIGLSGTLPMLVSPKQTGHYMMPAVAFYAIGAAALAVETAGALERRMTDRGARVVRIAAALIAVGAVVAIWLPALERDPSRLADLDRIAAVAPRGQTIGLCPAANSDWLLHAWMQRRFTVSLDAAAPRGHEWFLLSASRGPDCPPASCVPMSPPERLTMLRCR